MTVLLRRLAADSMVPLIAQGMHSRATLEVLLESSSACDRKTHTHTHMTVILYSLGPVLHFCVDAACMQLSYLTAVSNQLFEQPQANS